MIFAHFCTFGVNFSIVAILPPKNHNMLLVFQWSGEGGPKNAFLCQNVKIMKMEHFCIFGLKSLILRKKWLSVHFWVHRRQPLTFLKDYGWFGRARNALLAEMCLFGPKVHFWSKIRFLTQNAFWHEFHENCVFSDFQSKSSILSKGLRPRIIIRLAMRVVWRWR